MTESDTFGAFIKSTYDETLTLLVDTWEFLNSKPRAKDSGGREPKGLAETMSAISQPDVADDGINVMAVAAKGDYRR